MSLDGIINANIVEGSFNSELFSDFIEGLLDVMSPFPGPNSVIVMDNCRIHKDPRVLQKILNRGVACMAWYTSDLYFYLSYTVACVTYSYPHIHLTSTLLNLHFLPSSIIYGATAVLHVM
jgi:hypothetical protein